MSDDLPPNVAGETNLRLDRWAKLSEVPLSIAAVIFLIAFAVPIIWWPGTPSEVAASCQVAEWVTWLAFLVDYVARVYLSHNRGRFMIRNWFDLLVIALPMLRPLRLLRLITVISMVNKRAVIGFRGRVGVYVAGAAVLLSFVGALAVLEVERTDPAANIRTVGDAFWWSAVTISTVGYGDLYPVTPAGRTLAVGLIVCGIAVLGAVTGMLASWIVQKVGEAQSGQASLQTEVSALRQELALLRTQLQLATTEGGRAGEGSERPLERSAKGQLPTE